MSRQLGCRSSWRSIAKQPFRLPGATLKVQLTPPAFSVFAALRGFGQRLVRAGLQLLLVVALAALLAALLAVALAVALAALLAVGVLVQV